MMAKVKETWWLQLLIYSFLEPAPWRRFMVVL